MVICNMDEKANNNHLRLVTLIKYSESILQQVFTSIWKNGTCLDWTNNPEQGKLLEEFLKTSKLKINKDQLRALKTGDVTNFDISIDKGQTQCEVGYHQMSRMAPIMGAIGQSLQIRREF
jgi:hypothetical protein